MVRARARLLLPPLHVGRGGGDLPCRRAWTPGLCEVTAAATTGRLGVVVLGVPSRGQGYAREAA